MRTIMTRRKGLAGSETDRYGRSILTIAPNLPNLDSSTNLTCFTFYITFFHYWIGISTIHIAGILTF